MKLRIDEDSRRKTAGWGLQTGALKSEVSDLKYQMYLMGRNMREMQTRMMAPITTGMGSLVSGVEPGGTMALNGRERAHQRHCNQHHRLDSKTEPCCIELK